MEAGAYDPLLCCFGWRCLPGSSGKLHPAYQLRPFPVLLLPCAVAGSFPLAFLLMAGDVPVELFGSGKRLTALRAVVGLRGKADTRFHRCAERKCRCGVWRVWCSTVAVGCSPTIVEQVGKTKQGTRQHHTDQYRAYHTVGKELVDQVMCQGAGKVKDGSTYPSFDGKDQNSQVDTNGITHPNQGLS